MERKNQYLILSMVCHMVKDKNWKILNKVRKSVFKIYLRIKETPHPNPDPREEKG